MFRPVLSVVGIIAAGILIVVALSWFWRTQINVGVNGKSLDWYQRGTVTIDGVEYEVRGDQMIPLDSMGNPIHQSDAAGQSSPRQSAAAGSQGR